MTNVPTICYSYNFLNNDRRASAQDVIYDSITEIVVQLNFKNDRTSRTKVRHRNRTDRRERSLEGKWGIDEEKNCLFVRRLRAWILRVTSIRKP